GLHINPNAALASLHQLVNFATERWRHAAVKHSGPQAATISLCLADGTTREYAGNYWVFKWSQQNSISNGQLYCALAALERWLCDLIDAGTDVAPVVDALLRTTNSVSVIGVLVNIGKKRNDLFKGPLRPLLAVQHMYHWDSGRAKENEYAFDTLSWV